MVSTLEVWVWSKEKRFLRWVENSLTSLKASALCLCQRVCVLIKQQVWTTWIEECMRHRRRASNSSPKRDAGCKYTSRGALKCVMCSERVCVYVCVSHVQISHEVVFCRVIYLQVSMNEGLSYITSSVHITTTECVSTSCVLCLSPHLM